MLEFLIKYQRFLMLFLQGACFFIAFLILITSNLCFKRKIAIFFLEVGAVIYLGAPIVHLTYDGVSGESIRWFLIIAKSADYLAPLIMLHCFNLYVKDLLTDGHVYSKKSAALLLSAELVLLLGVILFAVSYSTSWYFFYDELNHYHRGQGRIFATIHVEVDGKVNVFESHDLMDTIEFNTIKKMGIMLTCHMDPLDKDSPQIKEAQKIIDNILPKYEYIKSYHDLRLVTGPSHTNVIFDIVVDMECKETDSEIAKKLGKDIHDANMHFLTVINVDRSFTNHK